MKTALQKKLWILLTVAALTSLAAACDTGWQYIGCPQPNYLCAIDNPNDSRVVLLGAMLNWEVPGFGGVYRHTDPDTAWEHIGLEDVTVYSLAHFPWCRPDQIFAATSSGLFVSQGDSNWALVSDFLILPGESWYKEVAVSPYDTSLWALCINGYGSGGLFISHNSGQAWVPYHESGGSLTFSREIDGLLYYSDGDLWNTNVHDSTFNRLLPFPYLDFVKFIVHHTSQPWIYAASGHQIGRYNEFSGDTIRIVVPDSIGGIWRLHFSDGEGLVVSAPTGLYFLSEDLTTWTTFDNTFPGLNMVYTSATRCVAGTPTRLFSSLRSQSLPHLRSGLPETQVIPYPNPSNGMLRFDLPQSGHLEISDLLGRQLKYFMISTTQNPILINTENLATGTYFYRFLPQHGQPSKNITGKFFITK